MEVPRVLVSRGVGSWSLGYLNLRLWNVETLSRGHAQHSLKIATTIPLPPHFMVLYSPRYREGETFHPDQRT